MSYIIGDERLTAMLCAGMGVMEAHLWTTTDFPQHDFYVRVLEAVEAGAARGSIPIGSNDEHRCARQLRTRVFGMPNQFVFEALIEKVRPYDLLAMARFRCAQRGALHAFTAI